MEHDLPLQLGGEIADVIASAYLSAAFGAAAASFWKRGSFRSGSNIGSSRSSAGVSGMFIRTSGLGCQRERAGFGVRCGKRSIVAAAMSTAVRQVPLSLSTEISIIGLFGPAQVSNDDSCCENLEQ